MSELAIFGGEKAVRTPVGDMFNWPIYTEEDEAAIIDVLRARAMSGTNLTKQLEAEFSAWQGTKYALGCSSGTAAIHSSYYGCGVGIGDEVICPSATYWASVVSIFSLGATMVFADIDPETLCIDPKDIEHRITERTKAIMVVHCFAYPADMDEIMEIARRHNIKVIEDVSHAQGGMYKGRKLGSIGDVGVMSMMTGKSLAAGESGMLVTDNREIYERAIAFGHYERFRDPDFIQSEYLHPVLGLPIGGHKYRMHQMSSAVGRVQLKHYDERCEKIREAMNYFWDQLEGTPGVKAHRPAKDSGSHMGGWYASHGLYKEEELDGLSVTRFCQAVTAEGCRLPVGGYRPLHLHALFNDYDVYGHGKPTRIANSDRDLRQPLGSLPKSENAGTHCYSIPWFKHLDKQIIDEHVAAFKKVAANYKELLADDPGNPTVIGWYYTSNAATAG